MFCPATTSPDDNPWSDFRTDPPADWMQNVYSHAQWLALFPDRRSLFRLPGVGIWTVQCDYMHTKYLGADQYFFGSVLWVMVYLLLPGTPVDNIAVVWQASETYYIQNGTPCRYSGITLRMFAYSDSGYPKLKGKAGEIRHFGHALHDIWLASMDRDDEFHRNIELGLRASCQMEFLLDKHADEFVFPPDDALLFLEWTCLYCQVQSKMANYRRQQIFNITMKHHYLIHCASRAGSLNPRLGWCFRGEDYMNYIRGLSHSCLPGTPKIGVSKKIVVKAVRALHFQMTGIRRNM